MPGLVPGIHTFLSCGIKDVDGRDKPGHDENFCETQPVFFFFGFALGLAFGFGSSGTYGNITS
jgi:hypothetical protein